MLQTLVIVDATPGFSPPEWLIDCIGALIGTLPSVAIIERHDETKSPFQKQIGWHPATNDSSLTNVDRIFVKYGYSPPKETIDSLKSLEVDRCLAAGFAHFDAGLQPTLITDLTMGSSLDRSDGLGVRLWQHHFGSVVRSNQI